jgi:hypothetical protein
MFGGDAGGSRTIIVATAIMDIGMATMIGLTVMGYRHGYGYYGPHWGGYGWRRGWDDDDEQ